MKIGQLIAYNSHLIAIITVLNTLCVVGVVWVLDTDATIFEGPKVPNFIEKPPFLFASEQSRMSTLSVQKIWAKKQLIILRNSAKHDPVSQ